MSILVNVCPSYSLSIKQERREEKLDERELSLRAKEEEVVHARKTLYAQADDIIASFVPSLSLTSLFLCESPHNNLFLESFWHWVFLELFEYFGNGNHSMYFIDLSCIQYQFQNYRSNFICAGKLEIWQSDNWRNAGFLHKLQWIVLKLQAIIVGIFCHQP